MQTGVNNHEQSISALNTGRINAGRPVLGSWLTYALGTESQDLPAYCVLTDPGGLPVVGVDNWSSGWLPSLYQGTVIRPSEPRIPNLDPPPQAWEACKRALLGTSDSSTESTSRTIPASTTWRRGSPATSWPRGCRRPRRRHSTSRASPLRRSTLYGIDDPATREFGTRCLIARRLVERGVRFVQVCTGNQNWDHHGGIVKQLPGHVPQGRSSLGRPRARPQTARAARFDRRLLGRRDGPACRSSRMKRTSAATTTPTASAHGWQAAASRGASCTGRPTRSATRPWKGSSPTSTTTPRYSTSSASTPSPRLSPPRRNRLPHRRTAGPRRARTAGLTPRACPLRLSGW